MKTNTNFDLIDKNKVNFLENILGSKFLYKKKIAPYGAHWIFFNENFNNKDLGLDGHPKRGKNIPLLKGYKRMFAGANLVFKEKIYFEDKIKKITEIKSLLKKKTDNKNIYFLNLANTFFRDHLEVLKEIQTIVFVKNNHVSNNDKKKSNNTNLKLLHKKNLRFNNIDLFRYSALTYNSHRIHYDLDYTTNVEGHENLLVHGPLTATCVINEINSFIKKDISRYSFSLLKPIYVNEKITLKVYRSKLDKSVIIAKVLKKKNEIAFSSEIQLIS